MKKLKLFLASILLINLAACHKTNNSEQSQQKSSESETRVITDHAHNQVKLPKKITKIVIDQIPILSTYMAYHGGKAPYIVGYAGSLKEVISNTVLKNIAPELLNSQNTVKAQSDINVEEIIKLKPDVIFYNASNKEHYDALSKTGIPCVGFATDPVFTKSDPIDRYQQWLRLLEDVFGEKGKMDKFITCGNKMIKDIEDKAAKIADKDRLSALTLVRYMKGTPIVCGKDFFGDYWLKRAGVKNVVLKSGVLPVNVEQIYKWNPDILFLDGPGLLNIKVNDILGNKVEGLDLANMPAVKNKRVYNTKLGMWNWMTPNPDAPLVLAWIAKNAYPEVFKDYDLKKQIKDYYKQWYKYDVSDQDLKEMLEL